MPGTLVITTLSDGTNSTSSTNCIQGSAKAWVTFTGSSGTVRASYNVSSVTRNGTGDYTVNFTNAFTDANYSIAGWASNSGGTAKPVVCQQSTRTTYTTTAVAIQVGESNVSGLSALDPTTCCISAFR